VRQSLGVWDKVATGTGERPRTSAKRSNRGKVVLAIGYENSREQVGRKSEIIVREGGPCSDNLADQSYPKLKRDLKTEIAHDNKD